MWNSYCNILWEYLFYNRGLKEIPADFTLFVCVPLQCECNLQFIVLLIFIDDFCRRVMILLDLHVVQRGSEVGQRIGNPQQYKAAATQGTTAEHSQFMIYIIWIVAVWEGY